MEFRPGMTVRLVLLITAASLLLQSFLFLRLSNFAGFGNMLSRASEALVLDPYHSVLEQDHQTSVLKMADLLYEGELPQKERSSFKPLSVASYPFVLFSAYRDTLKSFYLLGTTSVVVRQYENDLPVYRCEWHSHNGSSVDEFLVTDAQMLYVRFDENGEAYVPAIVNCTFNQSVGAHGEGGFLRLQVAQGPSFWGPHYQVEDVLQEKPGDVENVLWTENSTPPHKYAFCGPPMYGKMNRDWIPKWLAYHHYLWQGNAHFYFYDVGQTDSDARQILEPWIIAGLLTIIDAFGSHAYPSWYRHQVLFINDCLYRTRFTARWTFFYDLDELLYVPAPNSLDSLLEQNRDAPWMSFGSLPCSVDHCRAQESPEEWWMERMLWHQKQPECIHDDEDPWLCPAHLGRRKLLVNPRKVVTAGIHRVALTLPTGSTGVNFNSSIARIHHFRSILNSNWQVCSIVVNKSMMGDVTDLEFDDAIALLAPMAKTFAGVLLGDHIS